MTTNNLKLGRLPAINKDALQLGPLLTGQIPEHPASADYLYEMGGGWKMLGNDQYGDCVPVTWANLRRLMTSGASYPSLAQVKTLYKTQNPGFPAEDNGMVIQTVLEYLVKEGGPDGVKAVAFAKVDHTNPDEVKAAIAIFGSVWTGVLVTNLNQDEFGSGEPWDVGGQVEGGHSVLTAGYGKSVDQSTELGGDEKFITWAEETSFTDRFWADQVEEAWVVVWPEHLSSRQFYDGVDVARLAADYKALTGKTIVVPTPPAPTPTPTPTPTPVPPAPTPDPEEEFLRLVAEIEAWLEGMFESWHPTGKDERLADAAKRYLESR